MKTTKKWVSVVIIFSWLLTSEKSIANDDLLRDTRITPTQGVIPGEFYHGSVLQGKLLIKILFFGAVPSQGIHYVHEGTDLLSALLYAGGYDDTSKITAITIRRKNHPELIKINLEEVIEDGMEPMKLVDDDVVTVPYNWRKDMATISLITGFITTITSFTTTLIVLVTLKK